MQWLLLLPPFLFNFGHQSLSSFPNANLKEKEKSGYFEQIGAWLHYDISKDAAFCYLCMQADHQSKFLLSKKRESAFIKGLMLCISECALHTAGEPTHRNLYFILTLRYKSQDLPLVLHRFCLTNLKYLPPALQML